MLSHRLRHRIEIQEPVETQDPVTGEFTVTWQTATANSVSLASVPAEVLTGPGKEMVADGAEQAATDARINIRWFPGITQKMRVLWDGKTYNIETFDTDITGRRELRLRCSEGVNSG